MKPKFGKGNPLLDRINDMRQRAGMPEFDGSLEEPEVKIVNSDPALGLLEESFQEQNISDDFSGGGGEFGGGASDTFEDVEVDIEAPVSNGRPSNGGAVSRVPCAQVPAQYQGFGFNFASAMAPIPHGLYVAYKRAIRDSGCAEIIAASKSQINGQPVIAADDPRLIQCLALAQENQRHLQCHRESLSSSGAGTLKMLNRRQPWALPLVVFGALVSGYNGYKKNDGWKTTTGYAALGALLPLVGIGVALFQGFPLYRDKD